MANVRRKSGAKSAVDQKRNRNRIIAVGFFLLIGIVVLVESPLTRIRTLQVAGNTAIPQATVLKDAGLHTGMNLWQVNAPVISHRLSSREPLVQSVAVHINWLHGDVGLQIHEKHVVAIFAANGSFYRVLNGGDAYDKVSSTAGFPWPIVTSTEPARVVLGQAIPVTGMTLLSEQLGQVSPSFLDEVSQIQLDRYGDAVVYLNNGFAARFVVQHFRASVSTIETAVSYFSSKGYRPGLVDVTSGPPYEYVPFASAGGKP